MNDDVYIFTFEKMTYMNLSYLGEFYNYKLPPKDQPIEVYIQIDPIIECRHSDISSIDYSKLFKIKLGEHYAPKDEDGIYSCFMIDYRVYSFDGVRFHHDCSFYEVSPDNATQKVVSYDGLVGIEKLCCGNKKEAISLKKILDNINLAGFAAQYEYKKLLNEAKNK